jgi:hypothetical protein
MGRRWSLHPILLVQPKIKQHPLRNQDAQKRYSSRTECDLTANMRAS